MDTCSKERRKEEQKEKIGRKNRKKETILKNKRMVWMELTRKNRKENRRDWTLR
jgi:hypothetical protein